MGSVALVDAIAVLLGGDAEFLAYKGLTIDSSNEEKMGYILTEEDTDGVVSSDSIPMCMIYERPGRPDVRTSQVYVAKVTLDCYAPTGDIARQMADRIKELMHNWEPQGFSVSRFANATSFKTGIPGVKAHREWFDINYFQG